MHIKYLRILIYNYVWNVYTLHSLYVHIFQPWNINLYIYTQRKKTFINFINSCIFNFSSTAIILNKPKITFNLLFQNVEYFYCQETNKNILQIDDINLF